MRSLKYFQAAKDPRKTPEIALPGFCENSLFARLALTTHWLRKIKDIAFILSETPKRCSTSIFLIQIEILISLYHAKWLHKNIYSWEFCPGKNLKCFYIKHLHAKHFQNSGDPSGKSGTGSDLRNAYSQDLSFRSAKSTTRTLWVRDFSHCENRLHQLYFGQ